MREGAKEYHFKNASSASGIFDRLAHHIKNRRNFKTAVFHIHFTRGEAETQLTRFRFIRKICGSKGK
jgi:hypothetical protein